MVVCVDLFSKRLSCHYLSPALDSFVDKKGSLPCFVIVFDCLSQVSSSNYCAVNLDAALGLTIELIICCASLDT